MKKVVLIFSLLIFSFACSSDDDSGAVDQVYLADASELRSVFPNLVINKDVFDGLNINRQQDVTKGSKFEFKSVKRENDILKLELTYSGGCQVHTIDVVWDGVIYTDTPCKINLMVIHEDNDDDCEAYSTKVFYLDLKELIGDIEYKDICEYHLFSTFNNSETPEVIVTN